MAGSGADRSLIGRRIAERGATGEVVFDAALLAPLLGLSPEELMAAMGSGTVFQVHEQGIGEDAGRTRVTFRHRARQCRLVIDTEGRVHDVS